MTSKHSSNTSRETLSDEQLSAFADGQLPRRQAHRVATLLRRHPEYADRIHGYWRREAALYQALNNTGLPEVSLPTVRPRRTVLLATASAASLMLMAVVALWLARPGQPVQKAGPNYIDVALNAYLNAPPLTNSNGQPSLASFADLGLTPAGQQVLQVANQELREYRFNGPESRRLALYEISTTSQGQEGWLRILANSQVPVVEWYGQNKRYLLVGEASTPTLTQLAVNMQQLLQNPGPQAAPPGNMQQQPMVPAGNAQTSTDSNGKAADEHHAQPAPSPATMDM
tara:strand:- start:729 stop:1583 length:855 start_codon:yes stop_codon:yes gene_type:complete